MIGRFQVMLLPRRKLLISGCSLEEAAAFVHGYHEVMERGGQEAVIALDSPPPRKVAPTTRRTRRLRRSRPAQSA